MSTLVFGIDCATKAGKAGMVVAQWDNRRMSICDVHVTKHPDTTMATELGDAIRSVRNERGPSSVLLALDAPLGWPDDLSKALLNHEAGKAFPLLTDKDGDHRFFRRRTDQEVADAYKKTPLDVGADRIARTALAALRLLEAISGVAMAWTPGELEPGTFAIEVYPAATLRALGLSASKTKNYKLPTDVGREVRGQLLDSLKATVDGLEVHREKVLATDHAFDALVCVMAASHFLSGAVVAPSDEHEKLARREGWIWVKRPAERP